MIQPLRSSSSSWHLHWIEIGDPPLLEGTAFFLPTLILVTNAEGALIDEPRVMSELDQPRIENLLSRMFDQWGNPQRLIIAQSEDWDEAAWRRFSYDYHMEIRFDRIPPRTKEELNLLAQKVAEYHPCAIAITKGKFTADEIAHGLVQTTRRIQTLTKKTILLQKALEYAPTLTEAHVGLADIAFQAGRWEDAQQLYEQAIQIDTPRLPEKIRYWADRLSRPFMRAHFGRAMCLWQQEYYGEAAEICRLLIQLNPADNQGARFYLPILLLLNDDYAGASAFFKFYVEQYPKDYAEPSFLFGWALYLSLHEDEEEAKAKYREAMARNIYMAPMLLDVPLPPSDLWLPNDRAEPSYAAEFLDSYGSLWEQNSSAIRILREAYTEFQPYLKKIIDLRYEMADFQDQRYDPDYRMHWQKFLLQDEELLNKASSWKNLSTDI